MDAHSFKLEGEITFRSGWGTNIAITRIYDRAKNEARALADV